MAKKKKNKKAQQTITAAEIKSQTNIDINEFKLFIGERAWSKLTACRDLHDTEIAGWFISESPDKLFNIVDFMTTKQTVTVATAEFDDEDLARFTFEMAEKDIMPCQCQKIWVHTHPGNSCQPSGTDEDTFKRMMNQVSMNDWLMMFILAMDDTYYCRVGIKTQFAIVYYVLKDSQVDIELYYEDAWLEEFDKNIHKKTYPVYNKNHYSNSYQNNTNYSRNYNNSSYVNPHGSNSGAGLNNYYSNFLDGQKDGSSKTSFSPSQHRNITSYGPSSTQDFKKFNHWSLARKLNEYHVKHVSDLSIENINDISKQHNLSSKELTDLENKLHKHEWDYLNSRDYTDLLKHKNVTSVRDIPEEDWYEIVEETMIRKHRYFEYEDYLMNALDEETKKLTQIGDQDDLIGGMFE